MQLIPAIDIINGKCVRLTQGDYSSVKVYNEPFEHNAGKEDKPAPPKGQETVIEYELEAVHPLASFTVTVKLKVPVAVGVPVISPVDDKVNPGGKAPAVTAKLGVPRHPVCVRVVE